MKSKISFILFFLIKLSFAIPPEKQHNPIIPFSELKSALSTDVNKSQYFINIIEQLQLINQDDTVAFELTIPETWKNREIFIGFEGKNLGFAFSVNDQLIDIVKDTQNLAEWRLHRIAKVGINKLKFKSLHNNNQLYQAYIYTTPKLLISNYSATSNLDLSGANGILDIVGEVRNLDKRDYYKYTIEFAMYDAKGKLVFNEKSPAFSFGKSKNKTKGINYNRTIMNVNPWTFSDPYLYTLIINMRDGDDNSELEILSKKIGFNNQKIVDNKLIFNNIQRPLNASKVTLNPELIKKDTLGTIIHAFKKSNTNVAFFDGYMPQSWFDKCLQNGLLTLPDTNQIYISTKDSNFKLFEIEWIDTSKTSIKFKNFNIETNRENIVCYWNLKNDTDQKILISGNTKIDLPLGKEKIWALPENIINVKNRKGYKLQLMIRSTNASFWHSKNFTFLQQVLEF